jgi:hypothetical protein
MILAEQDAKLVLMLYKKILYSITGRENLSLEELILTRDKLYSDRSIIDEFIKSNNLADIGSISFYHSLKSALFNEYVYLKTIQNKAILISTKDNSVYCVYGILEPVKKLAQNPFTIITTALLSFKNVIIIDGLIVLSRTELGNDQRQKE